MRNLRSQVLYGLNRQIVGRSRRTDACFSLIELLPRQELFLEKLLRSLVNFFRLFEIGRSLLDFRRIQHILEIIRFFRDAKPRSRLPV